MTSQTTRRRRWAIRVTFANGADAFLRRWSQIGEGRIVTFPTKRLAELNAEAMVTPGLDEESVVTIVAVESRF